MRKGQRMQRRIFARSGVWIAAILMATMLQGSAARADEYSQILRGYEIISEIFPKKTKLNFAGKDWALVGLGSYLVNSTGCNDCHTHPNWADNTIPIWDNRNRSIPTCTCRGGEFWAGGHANRRSPRTSRPTKHRSAGGTDTGGISEVMRTGHDPDRSPGELLQVMPWPLYQWKTKQDLTAMYEYLRVIPLFGQPIRGPSSPPHRKEQRVTAMTLAVIFAPKLAAF